MSSSSLRLVLMRHAKSSWKSGAPTDHARPLNGRGRRAAPKVAAELVRLGWVPDLVLSSDAARTRETWERMRPVLGEAKIILRHELYMAGVEELRLALAARGDGQTVLALGHNPGWEEALAWLSGHQEVLKTADAALLSSSATSWAQSVGTPRLWSLEGLVRARAL